MIYEEWGTTTRLRWRNGVLQQCWHRKTIEYRKYNGNLPMRRCEGWEEEWRDVPAETSDVK